jgi:hypothetical protein
MSNGNPMDENTVVQKVGAVLRQVENSQATGYQLLAQQQDRRLARRRAVESRLASQLEPDDPRLIAARQATQQVSELALVARQRVKRLAIWPELRQDDWVVTGQVRQADGLPAVGVTIRVFDQDRKFDDFLGTIQPNAFGDFVIVYNVCHFREMFGESFPDLFIMVVDQEGQPLVTSTSPIPVEAGRVEHFDIQLGPIRTL